MASVISLDNPVLRSYIYYVSVLGMKMLLMSMLTGMQRFKKGAFANPEDVKGNKGKVRTDDDVERVRRAHMNDLENIPVFMIIAFAYVLSGPSVWLATTLFRVYTVARCLHTLVYAVIVIPQPARALSWGIGYFITIYMAGSLILSHLSAM